MFLGEFILDLIEGLAPCFAAFIATQLTAIVLAQMSASMGEFARFGCSIRSPIWLLDPVASLCCPVWCSVQLTLDFVVV